MLQRRFLILAWFIGSLAVVSRAGLPSDSLIRYADLGFHSDLERQALARSGKNDLTSRLHLFLARYDHSGCDAESIVQSVTGTIDELRKFAAKTEAKKIKHIYDFVHKKYFHQYKLKNSFADIFDKGEYNCVSATALYAIIFEQLGIPTRIMEAPTHVYLIANPETDKILVESTTPANGYFTFSEEFIDRYIAMLLESKLITKKEIESGSKNELFNKHYFSSAPIDLVQLAGLQYYNYSVYSIDKTDYPDALASLRKAYFLYPSDRNANLLKYSLQYHTSNTSYKSKENVINLALLYRFGTGQNPESEREKLLYEFHRVTQDQLISESNYTLYEQSYSMLLAATSDSIIRSELSFEYHYELARVGFINARGRSVVEKHLKAAYKVNPRDQQLQAMIGAFFEEQMKNQNDVQPVMALIDEYNREFDFTVNHPYFNKARAFCYLGLAYENFSVNQPAKGEEFLVKFESLHKENPDMELNSQIIEQAYATACGHYYKKGDYARAKSYLNRGLRYAPDCFGLKKRLSQF